MVETELRKLVGDRWYRERVPGEMRKNVAKTEEKLIGKSVATLIPLSFMQISWICLRLSAERITGETCFVDTLDRKLMFRNLSGD